MACDTGGNCVPTTEAPWEANSIVGDQTWLDILTDGEKSLITLEPTGFQARFDNASLVDVLPNDGTKIDVGEVHIAHARAQPLEAVAIAAPDSASRRAVYLLTAPPTANICAAVVRRRAGACLANCVARRCRREPPRNRSSDARHRGRSRDGSARSCYSFNGTNTPKLHTPAVWGGARRFPSQGISLRRSETMSVNKRQRLALLLAGFLACCGTSQPTPPGSIEIFSWWVAAGERGALDALIQVHEESHPGTQIVNAAATDALTARDRLAERLAGGNPPDLFQTNQGQDLLRYVVVNGVDDSESLVESLDELSVAGGWASAFPPEVLDGLSYNGHLYGVPLNVHRVNNLFFNPSVLEANGITPPTTIAELETACEALASASPPVPCLAISARDGWTLSLFVFETLLPAMAGADFARSYFQGGEAADDARVTAAVQKFLDLYAFAHTDARSLTWDASVEMVANGDAAFTVMGDWAKGYLVNRGGVAGTDFDEVVFPGSQGIFVFGADAFVLARGAPDRAAAIEFLSTGGSREGQSAFNLIKGSIPARTDVDLAPFDAPGRATAADFASGELLPVLSASVPKRFTDPVNTALVDMVDRHDATVVMTTLSAYYDILQAAP